ncbi:MAG: hypothetical protein KatS3mg031_2457 [Chitinophagales bacterium]|nr:MAG: hypothetical protein KatS3mg031_2457 [Chitinophagales bacterium]
MAVKKKKGAMQKKEASNAQSRKPKGGVKAHSATKAAAKKTAPGKTTAKKTAAQKAAPKNKKAAQKKTTASASSAQKSKTKAQATAGKKKTGKAPKTIASSKAQATTRTPKKEETPVKTRYSDAELEEFKSLIMEKLEAARKELKYLHEQINRTAELGGDDSDTKFTGLEDGTGTSEKEYLSQMASRQIQYIDHLEKALVRIANKTYGICRETGKLISKERLRAVPHATLSIEAKKAKGAS